MLWYFPIFSQRRRELRTLFEAFHALLDYRMVKISKNHLGEIPSLSSMAILSKSGTARRASSATSVAD